MRGITIISMILYHGCWDLVYLGLGLRADFLENPATWLWQQTICFSFILISGFCVHFSRRPLRHGLIVLGGGLLVSLVTAIAMPDAIDIFGILWMLGTSSLVAGLLHRIWKEPSATASAAFLAGSMVLFLFFYHARDGVLGFFGHPIITLPASLYSGYLSTFLGFPFQGFYSSDYYPFFPWVFLYLAGYFLYPILRRRECVMEFLRRDIPGFSAIGRHSLLIYLLPQPLLYGLLMLLRRFL